MVQSEVVMGVTPASYPAGAGYKSRSKYRLLQTVFLDGLLSANHRLPHRYFLSHPSHFINQ